MRVAVISSPRSGNMWLRKLLVAVYGLEERSAHTPDELDWETLPERCALQLHWRPAEAVEAVSFVRLHDEATNMHFWQGRPGLWNELIPTRYALAIASAHPAMLDLGYSVGVDAPTARARWSAIAEAS